MPESENSGDRSPDRPSDRSSEPWSSEVPEARRGGFNLGENDRYAFDGEPEPSGDESPVEPLVVIDWQDPDEFNEIYIDDDAPAEEETSDDPAFTAPEAGSPAFPGELAEKVRHKAWAEYAEGLSSNGGDGRAGRGSRRLRGGSGLQACVEILACVGFMTLINVWLSPDDLGFRRLELNPFVIPVILLGVRYGTSAGLAAGLLSALWIAAASGRCDLEDGSLVLPGLLVVLGALTGALSRSQGKRLAYFRTLVGRLRKNAERGRRTLSATMAVIRDLQGKIESEVISAGELYRMSRAMGSEDCRVMYESLLRILSGDLGVSRAAIYDRHGGEFRLRASIDRRPIPQAFAQALQPEGGLADMALRLGRAVSSFGPEVPGGDGLWSDPALLAGPIRSGGGVRALVVVTDLDLLEFSPTTLSRFSALLDWAAESLGRADRLRRPVGRDTGLSSFDPATGALRLPSFLDALKREENRARRSAQALRLLEVRMTCAEDLAPARRRVVRRILSRALFAYTRDFDTVGLTLDEDAFVVILSGYEQEGAEIVGNRIREGVARVWAGEPLEISFRFLDPLAFASKATEGLVPSEARAA